MKHIKWKSNSYHVARYRHFKMRFRQSYKEKHSWTEATNQNAWQNCLCLNRRWVAHTKDCNCVSMLPHFSSYVVLLSGEPWAFLTENCTDFTTKSILINFKQKHSKIKKISDQNCTDVPMFVKNWILQFILQPWNGLTFLRRLLRELIKHILNVFN